MLLRKLQSVQNVTARLITGTRRRDHITPVYANSLDTHPRARQLQSVISHYLAGVSTQQMIAASCPTALGALCGQLTFRLAWCRKHSAVTATELLQPLDLACRTLFRSNCAIQTSPTDCSDDSCRNTFFGTRTRRSVTSGMRRLRKTLTYLLTNGQKRWRIFAI